MNKCPICGTEVENGEEGMLEHYTVCNDVIEIKAKCNQDLYPSWCTYNRTFSKGRTYKFRQDFRRNEIVYICENNNLDTKATLSNSLFNSKFTVVE